MDKTTLQVSWKMQNWWRNKKKKKQEALILKPLQTDLPALRHLGQMFFNLLRKITFTSVAQPEQINQLSSDPVVDWTFLRLTICQFKAHLEDKQNCAVVWATPSLHRIFNLKAQSTTVHVFPFFICWAENTFTDSCWLISLRLFRL